MKWYYVFIIFCFHRARGRVKFQQEPLLQGYELFTSGQLGSTSSTQRVDQCASLCAKDAKCSIFAFDDTDGNCQLFDAFVYPNLYFETYGLHPVRNYYVFSTDWCDFDLRYMMVREPNLCVKTHKSALPFHEARGVCLQRGGTLAVLEDDSIASVIIDLLARSGLSSTPFYVGVDDLVSAGEFMWHDGRQMTRAWRSTGK